MLGGAVTEKAVNGIMDYIIQNKLQPGEKLPSERELVELIGVGRPALREALKIVSAFGIITIKQYDGIYVSESKDEGKALSFPFKLRMDIGQFDLPQLFEMRTIFEKEVMKLAAERITEEDIKCLESILAREDINNEVRFAECDVEFHDTIYRSTGNAFLVLIMEMVNELSSVSRKITGRIEETRRIAHEDHKEILKALKSRDVEKSCNSMYNHLAHIQKMIEIDSRYDRIFKAELQKVVW